MTSTNPGSRVGGYRREVDYQKLVSRCTQITDFGPDPRDTVLKSRILRRVCIQIAVGVECTETTCDQPIR
jgi:hypothetical protein